MRQSQGAAPPSGALARTLRELRDRTGLSLAALAARTPYSKSAWHRYLTGVTHPPRSAVEALARLAGADPAPALALWEAAGQAPPPPVASAGGTPARGPLRRLLPALTLLAAAAAATVALVTSSRGAAPAAGPAPAARHCQGPTCQGELPGRSVCADDARTESLVGDATYSVRLRYSPACGTAWSQLRVRGAVAREVSVRTASDVLTAAYSAEDAQGDTSPMLAVRSPRGVEACAQVNGRVACTGLGTDSGRAP